MTIPRAILVALVAAVLVLGSGIPARADTAQVDINPSLPGVSPGGNPARTITGVYQFALLIGGLLAFGAIVWSAIKYATAAGNTTQQSDARQGIRDAIVGLLLLVGAAIVLRIINPGLVENIGIIEPSQLAPPEAAAMDCAPGLSRNYCTLEVTSDPAYNRYSGRKCKTVENGPCGSTGRNTRTICGAQGVSCPANPTSIQ